MNNHLRKMEIDKYKYISFDIFDTLIYRNVAKPTDIFSITENLVAKSQKADLIPNFATVRRECEINVRNRAFGEITLDEIYQEIQNTTDSECISIYKNSEIECEIKYSQANLEIKEFYDYCLAKGKRIIIISDMYLPQNVIENILANAGYSNYHKLYVSSETRVRKRSGDMFEHVIADLNADPNEIAHIGDSLMSDFISAKKNKIDAYRYYPVRHNYKVSDISQSIFQTFLDNNAKNSLLTHIGYSVFGPFLYGYIKWLHKCFLQESFDKVYFLSRDGYFMRTAYNALYPDSIENDYLYASRRLFQVSALWLNPEIEDVFNNMYIPKYFSLSWLLDMLGLEESDYIENIKACGLELETEFDRKTVLSNKELVKFYNSIKGDLISNSKKEYIALISHLKRIGFSGKVAIVDVGWLGNMQKLLSNISKDMGLNVAISGYYVGVNPFSKNADSYDMYGYLFQKNKNSEVYFLERFMDNIFELFFIAPHGSAKKYYMGDDGETRIMLYKSEYDNTKTFEIFNNLQTYALQFIKEFNPIGELVDENAPNLYLPLIECFTNPDLQVAKFFGEILFWDKDWRKLAEQHSLGEYLVHPLKFKEDFLRSYWKPGYMKRLFRVPINYGRLLAIFYKKYQEKI